LCFIFGVLLRLVPKLWSPPLVRDLIAAIVVPLLCLPVQYVLFVKVSHPWNPGFVDYGLPALFFTLYRLLFHFTRRRAAPTTRTAT